jgi:DNA polymerase elongation subunit (family B)
VSWADLTISKTLADKEYANPQVHAEVAKYLQEHHPLLAPEPGDRVPFVVIKVPGESRATKGYEKGYNPVLAEREGKEPDWLHYADRCLKKPVGKIMAIGKIFGLKGSM